MNQKSYLPLKIQAQGHPLAQLVERVSYVQMPTKYFYVLRVLIDLMYYEPIDG